MNNALRITVLMLLEGARDKGLKNPFGDDFTVYLMDDTPKTLSEAYASPDA
jgi:hypothetical protein